MEAVSTGKWLFSHRITSVSVERARAGWTLLNTTGFYLFGQHWRAGCWQPGLPKLTWLRQKLDLGEESLHILAF